MNNDKLVNFPKNLIIENANAKQFEIGQPEPESYSCMDNEQINQTEQDNQSEDSTESILNNQVFSLRLDDFDGPIDLLLHLVKRSELPIEKLSLARVADQFLQCIRDAVIFDLELAGEYLVIAANLLSIKAALLVDPKSEQQLEIDEGPNPHEELLRRLREAEIYQDAARKMASQDMLGIDVFAPEMNEQLGKNLTEDAGLAQHDSALLLKALNKILASVPAQIGFTINWNRISIGERMHFFIDRLNQSPGAEMNFEDLLGEQIDLPILVSSFIAILELCKRQLISVRQSSYHEAILIGLISKENLDQFSSALAAGSEFDAVADQDEAIRVGNIS